jgi:hypothetical protein
MLTFHHRVTYEYEKLVRERLDHVKETLSVGGSLCIEQIRRLQGEVSALNEGMELLAEAISICEGKDKT